MNDVLRFVWTRRTKQRPLSYWRKPLSFGRDVNKPEVRVMFRTGIIILETFDTWWVPDRVKMTAKTYIDLFEPRQGDMVQCFQKEKIIFMHNKVQSHIVMKAKQCLNKIRLKDTHSMNWTACFPDFNPTENFWCLLKKKKCLLWRTTIYEQILLLTLFMALYNLFTWIDTLDR